MFDLQGNGSYSRFNLEKERNQLACFYNHALLVVCLDFFLPMLACFPSSSVTFARSMADKKSRKIWTMEEVDAEGYQEREDFSGYV